MLRTARISLASRTTRWTIVAGRTYAKKADLTKDPKTSDGPSSSKNIDSAGSSHGAGTKEAGQPKSGGSTPGLEEKGGHAVPSGQFAEQHEEARKVGGVANADEQDQRVRPNKMVDDKKKKKEKSK